MTVVDAAVAAKYWKASFYQEGTLGSCLSRCSPRGTNGRLDTVNTISLADAFSRWGVPELCKIDIEGAEIEVIAAAAELLGHVKTQFAIDTNHRVSGRLTVAAIEKMLKAYGFEVQSEALGGLMTTWARPRTNSEDEVVHNPELVLADAAS